MCSVHVLVAMPHLIPIWMCREADVLDQSGMSRRSVMNRLYYAMFYAVLALLQEKEMGTSKHSGAIALFDREFVKTGTFPKEMFLTSSGVLKFLYSAGADISIPPSL